MAYLSEVYLFYRPNFVVFYSQKNKDDLEVLRKISRCFGLFWVPDHPPRNQYRGIIRYLLIFVPTMHTSIVFCL